MIATTNKYEEFLASTTSDSSRRVYKSYSLFGEFDYTNCDVEMVERIILSTNPKDMRSITTACTTLKKFAKFLGDTHLVKIADSIDRKELWERIKSDDIQNHKFLSNKQYKAACHDIEVWEEHNSLYYQTLFMAIYEGIYSNDMSVLKNLRARDIKGNIVILSPDNDECYKLEISKQLADNLKELSEMTTWEQTARFGYIQLPLVGKTYDSCFKVVQRMKDTVYEAKFYYYRLRKIANNYIERPVRAYELFVSGIAYRIVEKLKANDITLQEAFKTHNRNRLVGSIISDELTRCHYSNQVRNFRELIESYLEVFLE